VKKTVIVTIEKEIEVNIPDELLTEEHLEEFSSYMFPVDSVEDLFEHAAQYVARFDQSFVEGIGNVGYTELLEDIETEIVA
jgi:hypothetical protein